MNTVSELKEFIARLESGCKGRIYEHRLKELAKLRESGGSEADVARLETLVECLQAPINVFQYMREYVERNEQKMNGDTVRVFRDATDFIHCIFCQINTAV